MEHDADHGQTDERPDGLLGLSLVALVGGAITGLICAAFRLSLLWVDRVRFDFVTRSYDWGILGLVLMTLACAAAAGLAAWLVRRFSPHASGSGIPHVEAVLEGELPPAPLILLPIKFLGGVLAIGAGLALGREGPSVQMGATASHLIGRFLGRNRADCRVLLAAGAGAGLATAFNAPIAGAIFVLEELVRRFETRIAIAALGTTATAIAVARWFLGDAPEFEVDPIPYLGPAVKGVFLLLGIAAGLAAVVYNKAILTCLRVTKDLSRWPVEVRAALIGGAVGIVGWYLPDLVGGGEMLTLSTLTKPWALGAIWWIFLLRFALGPISYSTRTPGGLFSPMLVVGAQFGLICGTICLWAVPTLAAPIVAFAVVGMAAFFTGVVRAPVTAIVLVTEMTGSVSILVPMLAACFSAMVVTTLLGNPPIYDSLREHTAGLADAKRANRGE